MNVAQPNLLYHLIPSEYFLGLKIEHGIFWSFILVQGFLLGFAGILGISVPIRTALSLYKNRVPHWVALKVCVF